MARSSSPAGSSARLDMALRRWTILRDYGWLVIMASAALIAWRSGFGPSTPALYVAAMVVAETVLLIAYGRVKELEGTNASGWLTARDMGWTLIIATGLSAALLTDRWSLWTIAATVLFAIALVVLFANFMLRGTDHYVSMDLNEH